MRHPNDGWMQSGGRDRPAYRASRASCSPRCRCCLGLIQARHGDGELLERARAAAASVTDPELPPLTIDDLGILRDVRWTTERSRSRSRRLIPVVRRCGRSPTRSRRRCADLGVGKGSGAARSDTGVDHGLADRYGPAKVDAIWGSRRPNPVKAPEALFARHEPGLSSLPFDEHGADQRVRFDRLQGAASLPELPGAVRGVQVSLIAQGRHSRQAL